ncbi:MAG: hypothetical protein RLZZ50_1552 [Verrucomicrobiota bacterium]
MRCPRLLRLAGLLIVLSATARPANAVAAAPELDLGGRVQPLPPSHRFSLPGYHVWCGAPVAGPDGRYHLFYSRWPASKSFAPGWAIHSEIAYAVADRPEGPYVPVNVALPGRGINPATGEKYWDGDVAHNPNAFHHAGRYYLYYTGNHGDGTYWSHRNRQRIGLAVADNPAGPWRRSDRPILDITDDQKSFDSLCVTSPAACLRPDGGLLLVYKAVEYVEGVVKGGRVRYGAAVADSPDGPCRKVAGDIFNAPASGNAEGMCAEDPFIWFSQKYGRRYYAVASDAQGKLTGQKKGLALLESTDGLAWRPAGHAKVLDRRFRLADGHPSAYGMERPALLMKDDEPQLLFGATDGYNVVSGRPSSNVQIPLGPAP